MTPVGLGFALYPPFDPKGFGYAGIGPTLWANLFLTVACCSVPPSAFPEDLNP